MKDYLSCRLEFLHTTLSLVDKKDSEQLKEENVQNALQVVYAKPLKVLKILSGSLRLIK